MEAILFTAVLLFSIVVHEVAHAWQAKREGDDTADRLGRITLNPLPHLDLVGSIIVPLALYFSSSGFLFGWAKPVPVDPRNYREYVAGDIRVSLAGIVSNLVLAALCTIALAVVVKVQSVTGGPSAVTSVVGDALYAGLFLNLILAFFNLIPIPPLDGSHVLAHLLPQELAFRYRRMGQYGILILMAIMFLVPEVFAFLLAPVYFFQGLADQFVRLWI
jgi:Zn-dependent protease